MIRWRKSSHSQGGGQGECVEVSTDTSIRLIRDSKEVIPSSSALVFEGKDRLDHSGHAAG